MIMTYKHYLMTFLISLILLSTAIADRHTAPLPEGIPNGYYWISTLWFNDIDGDTLRHKYYQVVIVNNEVDPVLPDGMLADDRLDSMSVTMYNSPEMQLNYNTHAPGMIDLQFTARGDEIVPDDREVQYGEKVLIRIFNADAIEDATHYRESEIWECTPGLHKWYMETELFGEWILIEKEKKN